MYLKQGFLGPATSLVRMVAFISDKFDTIASALGKFVVSIVKSTLKLQIGVQMLRTDLVIRAHHAAPS